MSDTRNETTEHDPDAGHAYDGIRELDHPAPHWWQVLFYLSIAFSVFYVIYYEMLGGPTSDEELAAKMNAIELVQRQTGNQGPEEKDYLNALAAPESVKKGHEVFGTRCASCHAADGGGLIGPNLADAFWIHGGGGVLDIAKVVDKGVLDKGMPPWGAVLSRDELIEVVAFVKSIQGKTVVNAKAPQGNRADGS